MDITENSSTGLCTHSHHVRIRDTTSAFIPCDDHDFISPAAVQLKAILCFVQLSQILCLPFCILIWCGRCFSKMHCISSYRAVGLWGISPWKSCKTAFRFGWKFHHFRYIWKAKKWNIALTARPLLIPSPLGSSSISSTFRWVQRGVRGGGGIELVERGGLV